MDGNNFFALWPWEVVQLNGIFSATPKVMWQLLQGIYSKWLSCKLDISCIMDKFMLMSASTLDIKYQLIIYITEKRDGSHILNTVQWKCDYSVQQGNFSIQESKFAIFFHFLRHSMERQIEHVGRSTLESCYCTQFENWGFTWKIMTQSIFFQILTVFWGNEFKE